MLEFEYSSTRSSSNAVCPVVSALSSLVQLMCLRVIDDDDRKQHHSL